MLLPSSVTLTVTPRVTSMECWCMSEDSKIDLCAHTVLGGRLRRKEFKEQKEKGRVAEVLSTSEPLCFIKARRANSEGLLCVLFLKANLKHLWNHRAWDFLLRFLLNSRSFSVSLWNISCGLFEKLSPHSFQKDTAFCFELLYKKNLIETCGWTEDT